ncbi:hypothetical protein FRC17_003418 [Serendipita sp. 399]|nr:hypothetical protein FRC17_003418 [Serendipita sp. 399]
MALTLLNLFPTDAQSPQLRDLHDVWSSHEALHLRYDATAKARCGLERTVRVERLLIASNQRHENGVLNKPTLRSTLDFEAEINTRLASSATALPCVQAKLGGCLYTSPLIFWDFDQRQLDADQDIIQTLNTIKNITTPGFPVTLAMVVAGRAGLEDQENTDIGTFLVLTYYFRDDDCHSQRGHLAWNQLVSSIMEGKGHAEAIAGQPRLLAIQFDAEYSRISAISILLYLLYVIIFINFSGSLRRMNTVHSRFGIAFTGIVEIIVSTVTSVSVCAIWGFRVTMVPWGLLPIIIVFIGAENMFRLVDEVVSTPITLPVKERIARGMSEAGASNTLKVVTCNAALGTIAMFTPGAIRQFCVFALVLHELLRQDRSFDAKERNAPTSPLEAKTKKETVGLLSNLLGGSAARNSSLIVMLAITAVLYSVTSSAVPGRNQYPYTLDRVVALRKAGSQSPAWKLWQTLNPSDDPLVHIRSEPPTLIFFNRQDAGQGSPAFRERKASLKIAQRVQQTLKVFVLPIAMTTTLLWALLVYLLKDTETRDVQENGHVRRESDSDLVDAFQFSTIPRACIADIDRVDATPDASSIIAVSLENEVVVWSQRSGSFFQLFISDLDQHGSFITSVAMDSTGLFCAAGTRAGTIALWRLSNGKVAERMLLYHPNKPSRIVDLVFEDRPAQRGHRPSMLHKRSLSGETHTTDGYLLASFKDGSVVEWNDLHDPKPIIVVDGAHHGYRTVVMKPRSRDPVSFAVISANGMVQLFTRDIQQWKGMAVCDVCGAGDSVLKVHTTLVNIDLLPRVILVTSTRAGYISLWDASSGERWYTFEDTFEDVSRVRLSPIPTMPCVTCGELRPDAFTLTISTGTTAIIYRFGIEDIRRCACSFLQSSAHPALRSRQGSFSTLGPPSRSRLGLHSASSSNVAAMIEFPVSAHGVHSRRGSERDAPARRQDGGFFLVDESNGPRDDEKDTNLPELLQSRVAEISFQEGAWDTTDHIIYGLRRSSDLETVDEDPLDGNLLANDSTEGWNPQFEGLDQAVLERWKVWIFDPTSADFSVRESTLAALAAHRHSDTNQNQPPTSTVHNRHNKPPAPLPSIDTHSSRSYRVASAFPRLPFTEISSLLSLGNSSCLVAFGNTIGLVTFSADFTACFLRTHRSRTSSTAAIGTSIPKKRL